ncbi:MAG TPA: CARDB domain-containing protein, partial [Armatimonadota bacterium]|nr:CARDB domain-containing protein [Armatimonadota bacterium]
DDLSGKLRITRVGTTVTGYYWDKTNEAWVPLGSATLTDADVQIQLHAWSHDAAFEDQEVTVAFDNFVVNGGQVVGRTPPDLTGQWTRLRQQTRGKGPNQRSTIRGQFDVANVGQTAAGFSALRFYLSADAEFGTGDVLLQHVNLGGLAPGQRQTVRLSVASERGTSARRKFVIAVLDAAGAVPEANEPDNVVARGPLR